MGLILPGTKRGAGFRKRSGDEFPFEILLCSALHKSKSAAIDASGARQGWMGGLQMLEGSSYHWYASLCNVVQDQSALHSR